MRRVFGTTSKSILGSKTIAHCLTRHGADCLQCPLVRDVCRSIGGKRAAHTQQCMPLCTCPVFAYIRVRCQHPIAPRRACQSMRYGVIRFGKAKWNPKAAYSHHCASHFKTLFMVILTYWLSIQISAVVNSRYRLPYSPLAGLKTGWLSSITLYICAYSRNNMIGEERQSGTRCLAAAPTARFHLAAVSLLRAPRWGSQ